MLETLKYNWVGGFNHALVSAKNLLKMTIINQNLNLATFISLFFFIMNVMGVTVRIELVLN